MILLWSETKTTSPSAYIHLTVTHQTWQDPEIIKENIEQSNKDGKHAKKKMIAEVIIPINKKPVTVSGLHIRPIISDSIVSPIQINQSHINPSEFSNFSPFKQYPTFDTFPHKSLHNKRVKFSEASHKQPLSNLISQSDSTPTSSKMDNNQSDLIPTSSKMDINQSENDWPTPNSDVDFAPSIWAKYPVTDSKRHRQHALILRNVKERPFSTNGKLQKRISVG